MLESECRFKGIEKPAYFDQWINLRVPFQAALGGGGRTTLQKAVRAAGLEWEGRLHCGLDDARNTARLLGELMRLGAKIEITGSLAPPPQPIQEQKPAPPQIKQQNPNISPCGGAAGACLCYCGVASRPGVVAVPCPMQGKFFLGCGNWTPDMGAICPFFIWSN
jgi:ERI1 exoribonuclease 2